jgi:hypothetical protein
MQIKNEGKALFFHLYPTEGGDEEGGEHEDGHLAVEGIAVVRPDEP